MWAATWAKTRDQHMLSVCMRVLLRSRAQRRLVSAVLRTRVLSERKFVDFLLLCVWGSWGDMATAGR